MRVIVSSLIVACIWTAVAGCPSPLKDCSGACYTDDMYCCPNGVLTQKQFCGNNGGGGGGGGGSRNGQYGPIDTGDRSGSDIGYVSASNADDCQAKCFGNGACSVWAFDTCGNGCWLKDHDNGLNGGVGCRASGVITASRGGGGGGNANCAYGNEQKWTGWNFYDQFNFYTGGDPTHGFVQFVDRGTATNMGLVSIRGDQIFMGVDISNSAPNGRRAVRLESKNWFGNGMYILDLAHMPGSVCGTWPAFWTVGSNWPNNGEIDIIEGVNRGGTNQMTLHTNGGCSMGGGRQQSGNSVQDNCDVAATGNAGCGVQATKGNSYGDGFNSQGGGVYVMERNPDMIKIWYFPRNAIPGDVLSGNPNPCNWPQPDAHFPLGGQCPNSHFGGHQIVFDITFCGDWAGAVFNQQCGGSCTDFVANNPGAFSESYWLINSLRVLTR